MSNPFAILLVEDSALMRSLLREMLRPEDAFQVFEAAHGGEALDVLSRERVDLVLSDWNMHPVNGLQLLQSMRADTRLAAIPFVLMTGEHTPERAVHAVEAGVAAFLPKPFGRSQLASVLAPFTGRQAA
ncbi:MAG TPA: response regulator [Magnetospirillum sp.]|jgi:two-component system chemotaxis response regulator CheY|nr:response regulator [Magnetospirillum sp.]